MLDRIWTEFQSIISVDDVFQKLDFYFGFQLFYDNAVCSDLFGLPPEDLTIFQNIRQISVCSKGFQAKVRFFVCPGNFHLINIHNLFK